jgi:hypothetical protein
MTKLRAALKLVVKAMFILEESEISTSDIQSINFDWRTFAVLDATLFGALLAECLHA